MRRMVIALVLAAGCHAHQTAASRQTAAGPPKVQQPSSERPVRTTPTAMLDAQSLRRIQSALGQRGYDAGQSGQLDDQTERALRRFQKHEKIAETGLPDYDTLRRLGLDPKAIYLGGTSRKNRAQR